MRLMLTGCMAFLLSGVSAAAETRFICENPRREYLVMYSPGASELVLNPDSEATKYPILVDDVADGSHVVTATTPNSGPTARLHLRPYKKMELGHSHAAVAVVKSARLRRCRRPGRPDRTSPP